jgi:small subunit ribosomal protein S11
MGKKRIIEHNKEDLLKEKEKIDIKTKKEVKVIAKGVKEGKLFIFSSYNNTIFTLTDVQGNVLGWTSAGSIGFKGTKKGTPFAASKAAGVMLQIIKKLGIGQISLLLKGIGVGRDSAIKSFANVEGLNIISIKERTSLAHGGCRPPKPRRV